MAWYVGASALLHAIDIPADTPSKAIMWIIIAAGDLRTQAVETSILIGMLVTSCLPTTIASNIVMTRNAGGDDAAAIIEVVIGNVFGSFVSPGLIYVLIPNKPEFQQWTPAQLSELGQMYGNVAQKLGLTVILPLAVGQGVRILFEKQVVWCVTKLYLGKISTLFLCTLVWYVWWPLRPDAHPLTINIGPPSPTLSRRAQFTQCPEARFFSTSS